MQYIESLHEYFNSMCCTRQKWCENVFCCVFVFKKRRFALNLCSAHTKHNIFSISRHQETCEFREFLSAQHKYKYKHTHTHTHTYTHTHIYTHIYTHTYRHHAYIHKTHITRPTSHVRHIIHDALSNRFGDVFDDYADMYISKLVIESFTERWCMFLLTKKIKRPHSNGLLILCNITDLVYHFSVKCISVHVWVVWVAVGLSWHRTFSTFDFLRSQKKIFYFQKR